MYIAIDGDDSGRKIASCYLNNQEYELTRASEVLTQLALEISRLLTSNNFRIIFCAADGVAAASPTSNCDWNRLFSKIQSIALPDFTFSAGVGCSLQEAYIALLHAKSSGKNRLSHFSEMSHEPRQK